MFVISCHADTGFREHGLSRAPGGVLHGHLDNFAGVAAVMQAYFSGRMDGDCVRIELTYGEETGMEGAREVRRTLKKKDLVAVVDVTGTPTRADFVIEKCQNKAVRAFLDKVLAGLRYDCYEGCPDPVACCDETDVYRKKCPHTFFLGVPVWGGDYNEERVYCRERSLKSVAEALCRMAERFDEFAPGK